MVRFARADGSKGSNKRVLEEPTPWAEMVPVPTEEKSKKRNRATDGETTGAVELSKVKKKKRLHNESLVSGNEKGTGIKSESQKELKSETGLNIISEGGKEKKKRKKKSNKETSSAKNTHEYTINKEGQRVKVFKDGAERTWFDLPYEESDRMTRYDNMWVKCDMVPKLDELKASLKEQNLDEKEVMRSMMKAKRKAHRELRIELIYEQKRLVEEQEKNNGDGKITTKNLTKQKQKKQKHKTKVDKGESENATDRSSKQNVIFNEIQKIDHSYKNMEGVAVGYRNENNRMFYKDLRNKKNGYITLEYNKQNKHVIFSKDEDMGDSDGSLTEEEEGCHSKEQQAFHKNSKETKSDIIVQDNKHNKTTFCSDDEEIDSSDGNMEEEKEEDTVQTSCYDEKMDNSDSKEEKEEYSIKVKQVSYENPWNKSGNITMKGFEENVRTVFSEDYEMENSESNMRYEKRAFDGKKWQEHESPMGVDNCAPQSKNNTIPSEFEENDFMTRYEGFWVMRKAVDHLNATKEEKLEEIYSARTNGDKGKELTVEEQISFQRAMKKEKRFEHKKLLRQLAKREGCSTRNWRQRGQQKKANSDNFEVVKFDGFWIKKEAADRLYKIKKRLISEGVSEEELQKILQKERRKEERVLKNERKLVCLKCRNPGHMISACPEVVGDTDDNQITGTICYTCGSTEHTSRDCSLKRKGAEFAHATCFICGEMGHISRECPDNPRGLYPNGGACRACGSVEHFVKDCPDAQKENETSTLTVGRINMTAVEALDSDRQASDSTDSHLSSMRTKTMKVVTF